jgi:hypothetical protein
MLPPPTLAHQIGTVLWVAAFGIWYALVVAWEEARQDEINRKHGEGEA